MKFNKTQTRLQELGIEFEVYTDNYKGADDNDVITFLCGKCGGKGYIFYYSYHDGGICYECQALPERMEYDVTVAELRRRDRERVNRRNREILKSAEERVAISKRLEDFKVAHPGMYERLEGLSYNNRFASSLFSYLDSRGELTDRQFESVLGLFEKDDEFKAERENSIPVPEGKETITGVVAHVKYVDNPFSYSGGRIPKIVVKDNRGFKVYGTAPKALLEDDREELVGKEVTFVATLNQSDDDESFGFYSRPSKAKFI